MNSYHEKISKILRIDKTKLVTVETALNKATGKTDVLKNIVDENESLVRARLDSLGLGRNVGAFEVYDALISKIEADDMKIFDSLNLFSLRNPDTGQKIVDFVKKLHPLKKGYFLKHDKAIEFLQKEPPKKIMEALGYADVNEMIKNEDLLEVYSALRFLENPEWLNGTFFKQYESLQPSDFEERLVEMRSLDQKWVRAAEKFVTKKYHNVSHLKELGVIFIIPIFLGISGETLRLISLLLHYSNEVTFYSDIIKASSENNLKFATDLISLLRGDVIDHRLDTKEGEPLKFLVIQRYLAKGDENDWRLFEPHINPEAMHWKKAEDGITEAERYLSSSIQNGLCFWEDLDWVGDFFRDEVGRDLLVSFNLVDTVMTLVKEKEMIKYLYHHQEALWNKIFSSYYGQEVLEKRSRDSLLRGYFEI
ncbi:hypothetical protein GW950_01230 [Candidatus Wolfebacteria bacterium]|nr:hypothetical protein [Candidatus Wolfebacteria bacterium]